MLLRVLLLSADAPQALRLQALLPRAGLRSAVLPHGEDVFAHLEREPVDLVLAADARLGSEPEAFIARLCGAAEHPELIVVARQEDPRRRAQWLAAGALSILYGGLDDVVLRRTLRTLIARRRTERVRLQAARRAHKARGLSEWSSRSAAMQQCLEVARRVAAVDSPLLFLGETGVGKELLARAVHAASPRRDEPFIAVNCAAIPEALLESELFGHEEGAFTGAARARRGLFELADRGALLLDEIGDLPLHLQAKLLRALQDGAIRPVGAEDAVELDVRIMAATHRELEREIEAGRFRADLYYRLSVVSLRVPPLRERPEDLPELAQVLLGEIAPRLRRPLLALDADALEALTRYAWPGNVRELANVLERAALLCVGDALGLDDLPGSIRGAARPLGAAGRSEPAPTRAPGELFELPWVEAREQHMAGFEREYFRRLLERSHGRVGLAAQRAGIDPRSLYSKLRQLGLHKEEFQAPLA